MAASIRPLGAGVMLGPGGLLWLSALSLSIELSMIPYLPKSRVPRGHTDLNALVVSIVVAFSQGSPSMG